MNDIKVSVLCSTYNHVKYIEQAIRGILCQKASFRFEIIIHDDASTDGTSEIVKKYADLYPDIVKAIIQEHNSFNSNINRVYDFMLPLCEGEYIAVCEGDDYWVNENKLQIQVDYMDKNPNCSLIGSLAKTFHEKEKCFTQYCSCDYPANNILSFKDVLMGKGQFPLASILYRKSFYFENETFLRSIRLFDYVIKVMLAHFGYVYIIPEITCVYRKGSAGSWTNSVSKNRKKYDEFRRKEIDNYCKIDAYTNFIHHDDFLDKIKHLEFNILMDNCNFKTAKSKEYLDLYKTVSFKQKIYYICKRFFPRFSDFAISMFRRKKSIE